MAKLEYTEYISNGNDCDATVVMTLLGEARDTLNSLSIDNIASEGLFEIDPDSGQRVITMDLSEGHTHNGVDSRELVDASEDTNGGVKRKIVAAGLLEGWSDELNEGTMDTIILAQILHQNDEVGSSATAYLDSTPTGGPAAGSGWSSRLIGAPSTAIRTVYVLVDTLSSPNRIWAYADGNGSDDYYQVVIVGY